MSKDRHEAWRQDHCETQWQDQENFFFLSCRRLADPARSLRADPCSFPHIDEGRRGIVNSTLYFLRIIALEPKAFPFFLLFD